MFVSYNAATSSARRSKRESKCVDNLVDGEKVGDVNAKIITNYDFSTCCLGIMN